jgi:hypothetical protein
MHVKYQTKIALIVLAGSMALGCQFNARSAEDYQKETAQLLESRADQLKSCYDEILKTDSKAAGTVTVNFSVEPKTGSIVNPSVDAEKSTASEPLQQCVVTALEGLALDPPDAREGVASFTYEFTANEPKQG